MTKPNMENWNKMAQPPASVLKPIAAGRLKGKSDINPQWRYQIMTEVYGPCGTGWYYTIDRLWTEAGSAGQVAAFAQISLYVKTDGGEWSQPIPGIGGSMLVENESKGPYTSDEAYKMAVTDALSVAFKVLGVAADIYFGRWDGSKYSRPPQTQDAVDPEIKDKRKTLGEKIAAIKDKLEKSIVDQLRADFEKATTTEAIDALEKRVAKISEDLNAKA